MPPRWIMVFGPSQVEQSAPRIDPPEFLRRVMEAHVAGQWSSEEEQQKLLEDAKIVFERVVTGWGKPDGLGSAR